VLPFQASRLFTGNEEGAAYLAKRGWTVQQEEREPTTPGEALSRCYALGGLPLPIEVTASAHSDLEAEVRFVLTHVTELLHQGIRADDIVLVARQDNRYGPLVKAIAWEYELPVKTLLPAAGSRDAPGRVARASFCMSGAWRKALVMPDVSTLRAMVANLALAGRMIGTPGHERAKTYLLGRLNDEGLEQRCA